MLGALYNKQVNVHGLGFSPDGALLAVVNVTTNSVVLVKSATNRIRGIVYLRRAPHEAFFTLDGRQIWVAVRGENHIAVIDVGSLEEVGRIEVMDGPLKVAFRADGEVALVNSAREPELDVIDVRSKRAIRRITGLVSSFSPDFSISPDGREVWQTHDA